MDNERDMRMMWQCQTPTIWFESNGSYNFLKDGQPVERYIPLYEDYIHCFSIPYKVIGRAISLDAIDGMRFIEKEKASYRLKYLDEARRKRVLEMREEDRLRAERQAEEDRRAAISHQRRRRRQCGQQRQDGPLDYGDELPEDRDTRRTARQPRDAPAAPTARQNNRAARARQIPAGNQAQVPGAQPADIRQDGMTQHRPLQARQQIRSEIYVDPNAVQAAPPAPNLGLRPGTKRQGEPAENPHTKRIREANIGMSTPAGHVKRDTDLNKVPKDDNEGDKENRQVENDDKEENDSGE